MRLFPILFSLLVWGIPALSFAQLNPQGTELSQAVEAGDLTTVERLLDSGEDPNQLVGPDRLPLLVMVLLNPGEDTAALVGLLLDAGAETVIATPDGLRLPLVIAAAVEGEAEAVRMLIEAGADPNATVPFTASGVHTGLIAALDEGMTDSDRLLAVVQALLDGGADPNMTALGQLTPLAMAEARDYDEVASLLREAGAVQENPYETAFADCTPGVLAESALPQVQAAVRYDIIGPQNGGCRMAMTFTENPNPDWVNQELRFTVDPGGSTDQIQGAVETCISGIDDAHLDCAGPLLDVMAP